MTSILITGGCGFIGSAVVRQAIADGHQVINVDSLTYAANPANVASIAGNSNYRFEQIDIRDGSALANLIQDCRPDAIMHLAAESHVDRSIDGPDDFITTNIVGTSNLLQAARQYWGGLDGAAKGTFRFHHISTDEVYGDLGPGDPAFTEDTRYDPSSPYSASKAASDHLVRAWGRTYGLPVVISNCSNNYGPYQFPEKLIPVVILKAVGRQPIPVYGRGENVRDWLYVKDHADALLTILARGKTGETYNVGGNTELSNIDLVRRLCGLIGEKLADGFNYESLIEFVDDRPGHDRRYAVNAGKLEREIGWTPETDIETGLAQTLDWYLDNQDWWRPLLSAGRFGQRLGKT